MQRKYKLLSVLSLCATLCFLPYYKVKAAGVVVAVGGGEESAVGDKSGWSYNLYKRLVDNGDINGDKKVKVVVLSYYKPSSDDTTEAYFKNLGATSAQHLIARNRKDANNPKIINELDNADVIFFRGGDQAEYYRNWKNTRLFEKIKSIDKRGGAIGGTSAGAMSLAGYALAGGQELGSKDVLSDGKSPYLDDQLGGTSIHHFLNIVPNTYIDTHCGERARLGRLLGVHAKATEDSKNNKILGVCLSEQTGVAIANGKADVYGKGTVDFIQQTPDTKRIRRKGQPLVYTDIRDDVLTEGWSYDMNQMLPDTNHLPHNAMKIIPQKKCGEIQDNTIINGAQKQDVQKFEYHPNYGKENYELVHSSDKEVKIKGVIGLTRTQTFDDDPSGGAERAKIQAALYRSLYDAPGRSVIHLPEESKLVSENDGKHISFEKNSELNSPETSALILDCSSCNYIGLSPRVTDLDNGSGSLHLPTLINLRVHAIGASKKNNLYYNLKTHKVSKLISKGIPSDPCNKKDSLSQIDIDALRGKLDSECEQ